MLNPLSTGRNPTLNAPVTGLLAVLVALQLTCSLSGARSPPGMGGNGSG
jgi:hypothetical protein